MRECGRLGSLAGAAAALALAVTATACSNGQNPVSPAGIGGNLEAKGGVPTARAFTATFTGAPISELRSTALSLTLVITNDASTAVNQDLGYAEIAIPSGFSGTSIGSVSASAGKSWSATIVGATMRVVANAPEGQNRLTPGQSVTVSFSTTTPAVCDFFVFAATAFKAAPADTPFTLLGTNPGVLVTGCDAGCTFGQGYWKNHPSVWPVASLTLGTVSYNHNELLAILDQSVGGNGLISLAHQLIAAKLNVANGAESSAIAASIAAADALIGTLVVPPSGSDSLAPSVTGALNTALTNYNEGVTGPGACFVAGS